MELIEVKKYLRIDYDDEDDFLNDLILVSEIYIDECCGSSYKLLEDTVKSDKLKKLAKIAQFKLINDMYEKRTAVINESRDNVITTIFDKLSNV